MGPPSPGPTVPNLVLVHSRANELTSAGFRTNSEEHAAVDCIKMLTRIARPMKAKSSIMLPILTG